MGWAIYFCTLLQVTLIAALQLEKDYITIGSTVKLVNQAYKVRLHSHDVKYGTGSGQQSVTGMNAQDDANSYWQIRSPSNAKMSRGTPIQCGQSIRLMHLNTEANLHSHNFKAPMSSDQQSFSVMKYLKKPNCRLPGLEKNDYFITTLEISCFGEGGEGDHLDDWVVVCDGTFWKRNEIVKFKHHETNTFLGCTAKVYGRPIHGQQEVVASRGDKSSSSVQWRTMEGVILRPSENIGVQ